MWAVAALTLFSTLLAVSFSSDRDQTATGHVLSITQTQPCLAATEFQTSSGLLVLVSVCLPDAACLQPPRTISLCYAHRQPSSAQYALWPGGRLPGSQSRVCSMLVWETRQVLGLLAVAVVGLAPAACFLLFRTSEVSSPQVQV